MARVLGIDPGLTRTGYALVVDGEIGPVAEQYGVIRTNLTDPVSIRLAELAADIDELITETSPDVLAIERIFLHHNRDTAGNVARVSGVILAAAGAKKIDTVEYSPSQIKASVAGSGTAPKTQIQRIVTIRLGLPALPDPPDVADAIAIALCHLANKRTFTIIDRI